MFILEYVYFSMFLEYFYNLLYNYKIFVLILKDNLYFYINA